MKLILATFIGALAGAHSATWGMYKDSIYEGFTCKKYFRSIILSATLGMVICCLLGFRLARASEMVVFFGLVYISERAILEFYKTFLREEDQSKYFIPMQLHFRGRVVKARWARWLAGAAYLFGIIVVFAAINVLESKRLPISGAVTVLLIGSLGGWISAFGGVWKDAPIEGFELLKFFRSPAIGLSYAFLMALFSRDYIHIVMAATGYTVATIETYKTFFFPNKPRGKFAGKPIRYPEMLAYRRRFVPLYAGIWLMIVVMFAVALADTSNGLISFS